MADNKKMVLIVGSTGTGKTTSLRNLPLDKTAYIDVDRKSIKAFPGMEKMAQWAKLDYVDHVLPGIDALEADPTIEYVVIDTLSFMLDMFVAQKVDTAADTREAWGQYKKFYKALIHKIKAGTKSYIILAHDKSSFNEQSMEVKTQAYAQGSISGQIEADFALVAYTHKYVGDDGLPKYGFLVSPTKDTLALSAKSPMGMFPEALVADNDVQLLLEAIDAY